MKQNLSGMWAVAKLDLLMWRRMPTAIFSALIPPIGMTLILVTLSLAVLQQPIALVVDGKGPHSQKMQRLIQSDTDAYVNADFSTNIQPIPAKKAKELLDSQQIAAIITVPADFDAQAKQGNAQLHLTLNNVDIDFADDIRRSVDRSVAHFDAPVLSPDDAEEVGEEFDAEKPNPYLMTIDEEDLRETNVEWLNYQVIPVLVLLVLSVGLIGTALLCAQDRERRTARILALSPQNDWMLIGGRLLGGVIASLLALIPAVALCVLSGVINPPPGHWLPLAAIFLVTACTASAMGTIVGTLFRGSRTIAMAASVLATYMFFLGGGFTTIAFLPEWLQTISVMIPMRYAIDGMRQALFYTTLDGVVLDIIILGVTALVTTIIGAYTVRRSWTE